MPKWIQWIDTKLEAAERGMAVVLYLLLIFMIAANVLGRNVWHTASHRLIELAPTVVLWLALVGATLALKQQRHIKIELALRYLPYSLRRLAQLLTSLFGMGLCGILAYASVDFLRNETILFGAWGWLAVCFPLFFSVSFIRFGLLMVHDVGQSGEPS